MVTKDTQQLVKQFLTCLNGRDLPGLMALFAEDIDWHIPGNEKLIPWIGQRTNLDEVRQFFQLLWLNTEPLSAKVDNMLIDGNVSIITGEFSTRMLATKKIVDSNFCIQITFKKRLIVRYRLLEDSYAVSEAMTP